MGLYVIWLVRKVSTVFRVDHIEFETNQGKILVRLTALQANLS